MFIEIKTPHKHSTIVDSIYRPPGGNLNDFVAECESMLSKLNHKNNKNIILAGDFNVNLLNHDFHQET